MNRTDKYNYWLDAAEYDLATAESMLETGRYTYVVFMCQQALEKQAKGLFCYFLDDNVPRVHNINFIFSKVAPSVGVEVTESLQDFFDELSAFYLQGRYPTFKEKISQLVDNVEAQRILSKTKEVFSWLKSLTE